MYSVPWSRQRSPPSQPAQWRACPPRIITRVGAGARVEWLHTCGRGYTCVGVGTRVWAWLHTCGRGYTRVGAGARVWSGYTRVGVVTRVWAWVHACGRGYTRVGVGTRVWA